MVVDGTQKPFYVSQQKVESWQPCMSWPRWDCCVCQWLNPLLPCSWCHQMKPCIVMFGVHSLNVKLQMTSVRLTEQELLLAALEHFMFALFRPLVGQLQQSVLVMQCFRSLL